MTGLRLPDDAGSLTVELIVLMPVLVFMAMVLLAFGRIGEARQQVVESSRAGAQVASVQAGPSAAPSGAVVAAVDGSLDRTHVCPSPQVNVDVSRFYAGGSVTVTVVCRVKLADLGLPGIPGETTVQASSTAPIDPYRSVTSGFSLSDGSSDSKRRGGRTG